MEGEQRFAARRTEPGVINEKAASWALGLRGCGELRMQTPMRSANEEVRRMKQGYECTRWDCSEVNAKNGGHGCASSLC